MAIRIDDVDLTRDAALVERFQAGDSGAFDELYRRYFRRLERFCQRRVGDSHEAEELAQEAFTRAYLAMPGLSGERRFYPWVSVIAARLCVDTHRRRGRTEPSDVIDLGTTDGGMDRVLHEEDVAALNAAMVRLVPRHREVLMLREHEGWTYQRIAEHYDVSMSTVEALLFRARKALRREFAAVNAAPGGSSRGVGGTLAGLPVIGWAARAFHAAKAKAATIGAAGVPALAGIASVVMIVGGTAAILPHHHPGITQVGTSATSAIGAEPKSSEQVTVSAAPAPHPSAPTVQPSPISGTPAPRPLRVASDPVAARACVAQCEVSSSTPLVGVGANPTAVAGDTVSGAVQTMIQLREGLLKP